MNFSKEDLWPAVEHLYNWQHGGTSFSSLLYTLIQKADPGNLAKIRKGFPEHVAAYEAWCAADNYGQDFFDEYRGIK